MPPIDEVGAPDPELKNSPIVDEWEADEQAGSRDLELEEGACYFNGREYRIGSFVRSGAELLKCSDRGVWLRVDERP